LTLFTVTDSADEFGVLERKAQLVSERFAALSSVDLGHEDVQFNSLVPSFFAVVSVAFATMLVIGKTTARESAVCVSSHTCGC